MVRGPPCICGNDAFKTQLALVEFVDKDVDYTHRVGIADIVVEAFGKQAALTSVFALNKAFHGRSLR
ncbi:hypothetical protein ALO66_200013 [Pseudomonas coronafaciens pv. atropurpurea]|nr:hypothetical protein ALO66_200013 [Pseudomonas coronafaciens pv. atropurpurea]